mgnify:CR=1 FL=1
MTGKYTVIIPTIWKSEYTLELLKRYSASSYVEEIILINNAPNDSPDLSEIEGDKLFNIREDINTYVNPAWNKGVRMSKTDRIVISNDDILFDVDEYFSYIEKLDTQLGLENLGYIGMHSDNYIIPESENPIAEMYENVTNKGGWGCLFVFHKNNWKPIPERLKIWFGDNYIHMTARSIVQLRGMKVTTKMSTSSDLKEVESVKNNDVLEWNNFLTGK